MLNIIVSYQVLSHTYQLCFITSTPTNTASLQSVSVVEVARDVNKSCNVNKKKAFKTSFNDFNFRNEISDFIVKT